MKEVRAVEAKHEGCAGDVEIGHDDEESRLRSRNIKVSTQQ